MSKSRRADSFSFAKESGFSLLEVLVAFTILAFSLSIVLKIFSSGLNVAGLADDYTHAVQIAHSQLAKVGVEEELEEGEETGEEEGRFRWTVKTFPANLETEESLPDSANIIPMQIEVTVTWGKSDKPRNLTLTTLKLKSERQ